ncbi:MAG: hypothetical protein IPK27_06395 [Rhodanobacteraceae bacterium]|nr:hypothetical protein [Rhodanobacteraceae bacterium]
MAVDIKASLNSITETLREAESAALHSYYCDIDSNERSESEEVGRYLVERAFIELMVLSEALGLEKTRSEILRTLDQAKTGDLILSKMGSEEPFLVWCSKASQFVQSIASVHGIDESNFSATIDLKAVLRRTEYVICDRSLFGSVPTKEADVHDRIEAILKCQYPDLKRKPTLSKPIKNFEPDSGIPSIRTLIEYKFVTSKAEAKRVVEEILADTRGYRSPSWSSILFVIYESTRVFPEDEWKSLLKECELTPSNDVIVLSGHA